MHRVFVAMCGFLAALMFGSLQSSPALAQNGCAPGIEGRACRGAIAAAKHQAALAAYKQEADNLTATMLLPPDVRGEIATRIAANRAAMGVTPLVPGSPVMMTVVYQPPGARSVVRIPTRVARFCRAESNPKTTFEKACRHKNVQEDEAAAPLFQKSCMEGDPSACYFYAEYVAAGTYAPKDTARANALFESVCAMGQHFGCQTLAEAYENGSGVRRDLTLARSYYERGCAGGNTFSCRWLDGKVDKECPHGARVQQVTLTGVNRVKCINGMERSFEVKATPAEIASMNEFRREIEADIKREKSGGNDLMKALTAAMLADSPKGPQHCFIKTARDANGYTTSWSDCD